MAATRECAKSVISQRDSANDYCIANIAFIAPWPSRDIVDRRRDDSHVAIPLAAALRKLGAPWRLSPLVVSAYPRCAYPCTHARSRPCSVAQAEFLLGLLLLVFSLCGRHNSFETNYSKVSAEKNEARNKTVPTGDTNADTRSGALTMNSYSFGQRTEHSRTHPYVSLFVYQMRCSFFYASMNRIAHVKVLLHSKLVECFVKFSRIIETNVKARLGRSGCTTLRKPSAVTE